jgi:light-regulated signal transduction histidine kinase (bacteriophytochrome)
VIDAWSNDTTGDFDPIEVSIEGRDFDVVAHRNADDLLIVEFEIRSMQLASVASFVLTAHKASQRLGRRRNIDDLLGLAAAEVRKITGFDRVMAYRFRHDDSGEVVRESRRGDLDNWEGRRYPSSDIPAQARRLYVLNTLRHIANAHSDVVAVTAAPQGAPRALDMSFCGLRSVSPIHIEYMVNMGVAASLSISIVIDGRLWGMIACHHGEPHHVPHGIRQACEVLGQILSFNISNLERAAVADRMAQATETLASICARANAAEDLLTGVAFGRPNPADLIDADVVLCLWGGKAKICAGQISSDSIKALATALGPLRQEMIRSAKISETHPQLAAAIEPFCGMLAVCIDFSHGGWLVWLRKEQIETVRWAGKPEKSIRIGPNGPRLTPRGSFSEWREDARGSSVPWLRSDAEMADSLRTDLNRIAGLHAIEMERVRLEMLAALGHDLRDPLHVISMAAQILQRSRADGAELGARIQSSSGRMSRLVTQILDMSRLQSNRGIVVARDPFDLIALLREIVGESLFAHPSDEVALEVPDALVVSADRDQLSQVIANLLSNARHHGTRDTSIKVFARSKADRVQFGVTNSSDAIPPEIQSSLFKAFKRELSHNAHNRTGLGLGLYIASEIVGAHGGVLSLHCAGGLTTFMVDIGQSGTEA